MCTLLVDGNNLLMRAIYATRNSGMSFEGVSTGPLNVFISSFAHLVRTEAPEKIAVAWDSVGPTHRHALSADYKAHRNSGPIAELKETAFPQARAFLDVAKIDQLSVDGFEADDIIASWWQMIEMDGGPAVAFHAADGTPFWVSPEDASLVGEKRWSLSCGYPRTWVSTDGSQQWPLLHRLLLGLDPDDRRTVDHRNGDHLDNRRSNLRVVTHAENHQNRSETKDWGHSQHRGVSWNKNRKKWVAYGYLDRKMHNVGYFDDEDAAADAAGRWRSEYMPLADRSEAPACPRDQKIVIASSDHDFMQLLGPNPQGVETEQVRLSSASTPTDRWTAQRFRAVHQHEPEQWPLIAALTGDVSDNVVGIPGIGPKRALRLLRQYDWDLDLLRVAHPAYFPQTATNLRLVDLRRTEPCVDTLPPPVAFPVPGTADGDAFVRFLHRYGLSTTEARFVTGRLWSGPAQALPGRPFRPTHPVA